MRRLDLVLSVNGDSEMNEDYSSTDDDDDDDDIAVDYSGEISDEMEENSGTLGGRTGDAERSVAAILLDASKRVGFV